MTYHTTHPTRHDNLLSQVRALPPVEVAERLGLERVKGERDKWRCPSCGTGALHIYTQRDGGAFCHGCKQAMTAIDIAMHHLQLPTRAAAETLGALYGITPDTPAPYIAPKPHKPTPQARKAPARVAIAILATDKTREGEFDQRAASDEAAGVLSQRAIPRPITQAAGITLLTRARWQRLLAAEGEEGALERGLLRRDGDVLRPLLFAFPALHLPHRDHTGAPSGERFGLTGEARQLDPRKYLSPYASQPTSLYGAEQLLTHDMAQPLYLCEGEINALSLRALGHTAVSCSGSGTWQDRWCALLRPCSRVILVTDGDHGGQRWARAIIESMDAHNGSAWTASRLEVLACPKGKDANDLLRAHLLHLYLQAGSWAALQAQHEPVRVASALYRALSGITPRPADKVRPLVDAAVASALQAAAVGHYTERLLREEGHLSAWCAMHEEGLGQPPGLTPFGRLMWYVEGCLNPIP